MYRFQATVLLTMFLPLQHQMPCMRFNDVCLTVVALDVLLLPCCDLLLLCTSYTYMHGDCWHRAERLVHRCQCVAGAVLVLYWCMLSS